jgi:hypothetical protein
VLLPNRRGPTVQFAVRYQGGRKVFDKLEGKDPAVSARAFAAEQRAQENGWTEIARVTTEIVERRR